MVRKFKSLNIKYRLKKALKPTSKRISNLFLFIIGLVILPTLLINIIIRTNYKDRIFEQSDLSRIKEARTAIVFRANINTNTQIPDDILKDRLDTADKLYKSGKIQKIIVSGKESSSNYNEPLVMYAYLISRNIPEFDIVVDPFGNNTYSTCYRAKEVYGITKAILVTQEFHLPRALYICESLGIEVEGIVADTNLYENQAYNHLRESFALIKAFTNLHIFPPNVVLDDKITRYL